MLDELCILVVKDTQPGLPVLRAEKHLVQEPGKRVEEGIFIKSCWRGPYLRLGLDTDFTLRVARGCIRLLCMEAVYDS